jgi:hypothetical protein
VNFVSIFKMALAITRASLNVGGNRPISLQCIMIFFANVLQILELFE